VKFESTDEFPVAGWANMEDALQKLDKLTVDEVWMVAAQGLKVIQCVGNSMKIIKDKVTEGTCVHSTNHPRLS
jgi:hypothetical protein